MYGQIEKIEKTNAIKPGLIKCESYTMIINTAYYTQERHAPFDTIFVIIKLITTGQPGTENFNIVPDMHDSDYQGYRSIGGSYKPLWNDDQNVIVKPISIEYKKLNQIYSRVYVIFPFKHKWVSDVVKYYAIPCVMYMLLLIFIEITDDKDLIGISSALVLANIALLSLWTKRA